MVVCKFFQEGNCRYGQNCRFEHVYGSKFSYHAPQIVKSETVSNGVTEEQLINQVQSDVQAALKGGQWLLSGYSPFKEKPNFPGLVDLSTEEARLFIYEAKANNNIDQAVAFMNNLFAENKYKYEQLLQPNATIIRVLKSLYKGETVSSPFGANAQGVFGSSSATSVFRSAVQGSNTFGQNPTNSSTSIFGQSTPNSLFGQGSSQSMIPSVFNQAPTTDAKSIFAQASHNVFGQNQPSNSGSVFSSQQANNIFGPSQPSNVFENTNTAAKSIFAQANQNVFNSNQPQNNPASIFATASQSVFSSSPFSHQNQEASPFTNQQQSNNSPFPNATSNIFQISNQQSSDDTTMYSEIKDLSPSDIEAFKADEFKLGFIPELPPPHSLCF